MANTKRDNNFTDEQIKGITISVRAAKKTYPFIKGWKFTDNYEKYVAHLYINLIVDFEEILQFYGLEIKDFYKEKKQTNPQEMRNAALLAFTDWGEWKSEEFEKMADKSYTEGTKVKSLIREAYTYIPENMIITYEMEIFNGNIINSPVILQVDDFVQQTNS
jgi:hypothetical protein